MQIKDIFEKFSGMNIYEERKITDNYCEFVFYSRDTDKWIEILSDFMGPAVKPAGVKSASDISRLVLDDGGILKNQTLFKKEFNDSILIAMFWPWQDNEHTTLKIYFREM